MEAGLPAEVLEGLVGSRIRMFERSNLRTLRELENLTGTVVHVTSGEPSIGVQFDIAPEGTRLHDCDGHGLDGYCYYVHYDEFEVIDHEEEKEEELEAMRTYAQEKFGEWIPDRFPLVGEKVIPNPETSTGQEILSKYGNDVTGLVVDAGATKSHLPRLLSSGPEHMPEWVVTVFWEGEYKENTMVKHLLPLSGETVEVAHVEGYSNFYEPVKEYAYNEQTYEKLDKDIIQGRIKDVRITRFDESVNKLSRNIAYRRIMQN